MSEENWVQKLLAELATIQVPESLEEFEPVSDVKEYDEKVVGEASEITKRLFLHYLKLKDRAVSTESDADESAFRRAIGIVRPMLAASIRSDLPHEVKADRRVGIRDGWKIIEIPEGIYEESWMDESGVLRYSNIVF